MARGTPFSTSIISEEGNRLATVPSSLLNEGQEDGLHVVIGGAVGRQHRAHGTDHVGHHTGLDCQGAQRGQVDLCHDGVRLQRPRQAGGGGNADVLSCKV